MPTAYLLSNDIIRVYYASRDRFNRSRISFFDVTASDPLRITYVHASPICELGPPGAFDDCGMMPTSIVPLGDRTLLYYTGWSERVLVPYHNSIGVLLVHPDGTAERIGGGPVLGATVFEPFFVATAEVQYRDNSFLAWYAACVGWEEKEGKMEPAYNIRFATSRDGLNWERTGEVVVDFGDASERAIASASVLFGSQSAEMWFCYRKNINYRTDKSAAYKIGYARQMKDGSWVRSDGSHGLGPDGSGWESEMVCYPSVLAVHERRLMFYNGNGFGASGIGVCEWIDPVPEKVCI